MGCIQNIVSPTWSLFKSAGTQFSRIHLAGKDLTSISESQCNWFDPHPYPSCTLSALITVVLFWTSSKFFLPQSHSPHPICFPFLISSCTLYSHCSSHSLSLSSPSSQLYSTLIPAVLYCHPSCTLPSSPLYSTLSPAILNHHPSCTVLSFQMYFTFIPAVLYPHSSCTLPSSELYSTFIPAVLSL